MMVPSTDLGTWFFVLGLRILSDYDNGLQAHSI